MRLSTLLQDYDYNLNLCSWIPNKLMLYIYLTIPYNYAATRFPSLCTAHRHTKKIEFSFSECAHCLVFSVQCLLTLVLVLLRLRTLLEMVCHFLSTVEPLDTIVHQLEVAWLFVAVNELFGNETKHQMIITV